MIKTDICTWGKGTNALKLRSAHFKIEALPEWEQLVEFLTVTFSDYHSILATRSNICR